MGTPTDDERYLEAVQLLNDRGAYITMARDERGRTYKPSRELIIALAEAVRCMDRQRQSAQTITFGSSEGSLESSGT